MTSDVTLAAGRGRVRVRLNPWDAKAFGFPVSEVLELRHPTPALFKAMDRQNRRWRATLCVARHPSDDLAAKRVFLENGFHIMECALTLSLSTARISAAESLTLVPARPQDLPVLQRLVASHFRFSRFHEDPWVRPAKSRLRYRRWIPDLFARGELYRIVGPNDATVGVAGLAVQDRAVSLVLFGIDRRWRGHGKAALRAVLQRAKTMGSRVTTRVSAANVAAVAVYTGCGFGIRESHFDYHRWYGRHGAVPRRGRR